MLKNLVEYVVKGLVENPHSVKVAVDETGDVSVVTIMVGESEKGRLIGKDGKTINAIRMLVNALCVTGKKISVEIAQQ
jgi:predicted RNA-binding protein YlqC (UPF0109 family)